MKKLYVVYDPHCGLCTGIRDWLRAQATYVDLELLASGSEDARRNFPSLPSGELAVVSDSGDVWLGDHAFVICLWALRDYRAWAQRLASPLLKPMARQAFEAISHSRHNVSSLLGLRSEFELRERLGEVTVPPCSIR